VQRLNDIGRFTDWNEIEKRVSVIDKTKSGKGGRPRYPLLWMVKMLFIQFLYNLSDPELEDQMIDRLSFQEFVGITAQTEIPDFSSVWRFKEALIRHKLLDQFFDTIVSQLEAKGLILKKGTVVDATIIASQNRPLSKAHREELEKNPSSQIDTDAQSTQKNGKQYFGYKGHIGVDVESKIIRTRAYTPANEHDITQVDTLYSGDERSRWGDKAYSKQEHKRASRREGIFCGVLNKATRNHPLSTKQKEVFVGAGMCRASICVHKEKVGFDGGVGKDKSTKRPAIRLQLYDL
jgi:IS5 family transposase